MREEFLAIASHELKTPLCALQLQVESLLFEPRSHVLLSLPNPLGRKLRVIHDATRRLERLVNQLLDLSRISAGKLVLEREELDLSALVRDVLDALEYETARADCTVTLKAAAAVVGAWDRLRVEQIVTNLVLNASKYGAGKPIDVTVDVVADGAARITVEDHGIGIAPEDQARLFMRFERILSARHFGGLGLGLWIVKQMAEAHGGFVEVKSALGVGSTFTVQLPNYILADREHLEGDIAAQPATAVNASTRSLAVIDDDDEVRQTLVDVLTDDGYTIIQARHGKEALELLRRHDTSLPRAILLDLMMPVMNGVEFCDEKRKDPRLRDIPVILLSASTELRAIAVPADVAEVVDKPISLLQLLALAERYCGPKRQGA